MKKNINKIAVLALIGAFTVSCADLDTAPQGGTMTSEQKKDVVSLIPGRLNADVLGMFSASGIQWYVYGSGSNRVDDYSYPAVCLMRDLEGSDMSCFGGDYDWFSTSAEYSNRTYTYANPRIQWDTFFKQIKLANDVLLSIDTDTQDETLLTYRGQALALRAFDYFNLAQRYAYTYVGHEDDPCIPIVTDITSSDPSVDKSNLPRETNRKVYEQIMNDINEAVTLLKDKPARADKTTIDYQVALGIRAKVKLVMGDYAGAAKDAAEARAGYTLLSITDVSKPGFNDLAISSWMWGIKILPDNITDAYECWPGQLSSFADGYTIAVGCYKDINILLYSKIPATDVRKGWWVDEDRKSPLIDGLTWNGSGDIGNLKIQDVKEPFNAYTNVKFSAYQDELGGSTGAGDWVIMRAEEMLLIEAEGLAMSSQEAAAKTLLEGWVKTYRDPSYTCKATSAAGLRNEIWMQRRVELWGEGHAVLDLLRLEKPMVRFNSRIASTNVPDAAKFNIAADAPMRLMVIPQREISSNNGISEDQNNQTGNIPKPGDGATLTDGVTD
ncbi:MAG: RagB/SusD family nutrient uptake outer membrane protein [Tidjanibacter sp.]|nr:RagB/SusD family nutrient uptake outer membrane protein [Tidjanibacter sp.]